MLRMKIACVAAFCAVVGLVDASVYGQIYYSYPTPVRRQVRMQSAPVVYAQPATVQQVAVQHAPSTSSDCDCGCGHGNCVEHPWSCEMVIHPGTGCSTTDTKPIKVDPPKDCDCDKRDEKFYSHDYSSEATVKVPKKMVICKERYRFERKTYEICGCKLEICIPCAIDIIKTEKCEPVPTKVKAIARVRTGTNVADIWVYDVKGLPSIAVLGLKLTAAEANKKFGTTFSY